MRAHIEMCRLREQGLGREISPWDWRLQETCGCVLTQASPVAQDHTAVLLQAWLYRRRRKVHTNYRSTRVCRPPSRMSHRSSIAPRKASRCFTGSGTGFQFQKNAGQGRWQGGFCPSAYLGWIQVQTPRSMEEGEIARAHEM